MNVDVPRCSRLNALVASVTVLGVAAAVMVLGSMDPSLGEPAILIVLTAAAVVGNVFPFVLVRKGEAVDLSFEEAALAVMFVLLPAGGVLAGAVASVTVSHVVRRRSMVKALYNHGAQALAVTAGLLVQRALGGAGGGGVTTPDLLAAGAGVLTYSVVITVLIWTVIATATGERFRDVVTPGLSFDATTCTMAVAWGLVTATAARSSVFALVLCFVPVVMLRQLHQAERQRHHLDVLLGTAVSTASAVRGGAVERAVLDATSEALRAGPSLIRCEPPSANQIGGVVPSADGDRWLIPGDRHSRDPFGAADQALLDGLAAIASIALENASFLEHVGRDPVTELPAGALFGERVAGALADTSGPGLAAVLVVKVGRLDVVKQTFGPESVNVVLAEIGRRLAGLAQVGDDALGTSAAGYLGDGEFALVVRGVEDRRDALRVAHLVDEVVRLPLAVDGVELAVTVSIGVAVREIPGDPRAGSGELVRDALAAASRIARVGGGQVQIAEAGGGDAAAGRLGLEAELRRALDSEQLVVFYQPILQLATGRVVGAEALVRWHHPERGLVPPSDFVPLAEETGLVVRLDRLVLTSACRQLARWRAECPGAERLTLSVNLSARQLAEPDLVAFVADVLDHTGIDPEGLCLEVTESGVMHDAASAAATLRGIRDLGVQLAIDDFGTGYSSLVYLRDFPVDALKVDRSFVDGMTIRPGDAAIVAATVRLAHSLGLRVVAEGVETDAQLVQLRLLGCDAGQGYLWSRPLPAEDFTVSWLSGGDDASQPAPLATAMTGDDGPGERDDVLSYLTHELRSPLTAVTGFADFLATLVDPDDADAATCVEAIGRNARELGDLLNGLEDVRSVNLGTMRLHTAAVDVRTLIETVVQSMGPQLDPHPVILAPGEPAVVIADADRLRQVLRNLLSNAGKFSPSSAPIELSVAGGGGRVRIGVRDHGGGIPEERRNELFRRFSRLGTRSKGMGIGLHLARSIARAHGGDITYQPAPGQGSIFTIDLPALRHDGSRTGATGATGAPVAELA